MKKQVIILNIFIVGIMMVASASCSKGDRGYGMNQTNGAGIAALEAQINSLPSESLSDIERNRLSWMREEEKLARDVYLKLHEKWGIQIFSNIASSEQTHMNAILMLLNKYGMADPASSEIGVFNNPTLQTLYTQLMSKGLNNLTDALHVGATIEDLDLNDLAIAQAENDNADIRLVYGSLQKGSRNHLRAFYKNLLSNGVTYTAQYIGEAELLQIVNSSMEKGF